MSNVALSHFDALVLALSPAEGFSEEDVADVQRASEAVNAILERRRPKQAMPKWNQQPDGRWTYDPHGEPTAEDIARKAKYEAETLAKSTANLEALRANQPLPFPVAKVASWNPLNCCHTSGATPEEARYLWPDKASWDKWCAARGKHEVSKTDAMQDRIAEKPAPFTPPEVTQEEVAKVLKHLRDTGQVTPSGEINPNAPVIPMERPATSAPAAPTRRKFTEADLNMAALDDSDGAGEIGGADAVIDVPLNERPDADIGEPGMIGVVASQGTRRAPGAAKILADHGLAIRQGRRSA